MVEVERLRHVCVESRRQDDTPVRAADTRGYGDGRNRSELLVASDFTDQPQPVSPGQSDIAHENIRLHHADHAQSVIGIVDAGHRGPRHLEEFNDGIPAVIVVLDDDNT